MPSLLFAPILTLALLLAAPRAQQTDPIPPQTLQSLVATIQDPEARQRLVDQLQALLAAQQAAQQQEPPPAGLLDQVSAFLGMLSTEIGDTAVQLVDQIAALPDRVRAFAERMQQPAERQSFLKDTLLLGVALLASVGAGLGLWWLLRRPRQWLQDESGRRTNPGARLCYAVLAAVLAALPAVAVIVASVALLAVLPATRAGTALLLAVVWALAVRRITAVLMEMLLAPEAPQRRLVPCQDETAVRLSGSLGRLLSVGIYGFFGLEAIAAIGADEALLAPLRSLYGLVLLLGGTAVVLRYRGLRPAAPAAAPETAAPWRRSLRSVLGLWWIAAIAYLVGLYAVWMSRAAGGFAFLLEATGLTALVLAITAAALLALRWTVGKAAARAQRAATRLPSFGQRLPRYFDGLRVVASTAVWILAAGFLLEAWGIGALRTFSSPAMREVFTALLGILVVVLAALVAIDLSTALTQGYLQRREQQGSASAKVRTLLPLLDKTIRFVVCALAGITILSQLGVQIAPILAGVGVLGLAVGFGAQTLVKDVITGAFILIEDSVSVGDIVNIAGTGGLVEAISIRTIRLRDVSGNVHTIPFSNVGTITNMTKDFSRYLIEAGVAYREDVDEVIRLLGELGDEMRRDPVFGPDILEPIEIMGLDRFEDSAVIVRARLKTRPMRQWVVGREFNRRMKKRFEQHGIEIPFPHRTIYFGEDKNRTAPPLRLQRDDTAARDDAAPAP